MTTPKVSRLDPGRRREQILDAANAPFAERAYDDDRGHASSAGVTRGLVHHYFGGRKEVYIALPSGSAPSARSTCDRRWVAAPARAWRTPCRAGWTGTRPTDDLARHDRARRGHRRRRRQARGRRPRAPRRRAAHGVSRQHRPGHAAAALRARMLDRAQPRRDATLAARGATRERRTSCSPRRSSRSCARSVPDPHQASAHRLPEMTTDGLHARQRHGCRTVRRAKPLSLPRASAPRRGTVVREAAHLARPKILRRSTPWRALAGPSPRASTRSSMVSVTHGERRTGGECERYVLPSRRRPFNPASAT